MKNQPLVSIICLCYNHEAFVKEALLSAMLQSYKNIEIIVVDDASSDKSLQTIYSVIKNYEANISVIAHTKNLGNTSAFNNVLKIAKGDYIIDFATDDVLLPECISLLVEKFKTSNYKNLGVVFANAAIIDKNGEITDYYYTDKRPPTGDIFINLLSSNVVAPTTMLVKSCVFEKLDGYDNTLEFEDLDFWIRSSRLYNYDYHNGVVMHKRDLENSLSKEFYNISKKSRRLNKSIYTILHNTIATQLNNKEHKAILKRIHYHFFFSLKIWHITLAIKFGFLKLYVHYKLTFHYNNNL